MPSLFLRPICMSVTYISKKILWYAWMQSSIPLKLISEWIMSLCHRVSFTFKYPLFPITDASEVVVSNITHWSRLVPQAKFLIYFLKLSELYIHVAYVIKIKAEASHNIKFQRPD